MTIKMKKALWTGLGIPLACLLCTPAFSADSVSIDVVITVQTLSIEIKGGEGVDAQGKAKIAAMAGSSRISDRIIFRNAGNATQNFQLKVAQTQGSWTLVQAAPQANQYRLSAIWHKYDAKPAASEYQDDDALSAQDQDSSNTKFFNNDESSQGDSHKDGGKIDVLEGRNILAGQDRNLFLKLDLPSGASGSGVTVQLTATAIPTP